MGTVSRRRIVQALGAAGVLGLLGWTAVDGLAFGDELGSEYANTVDIVEAGADNTGTQPIDDVLESVVADDTMVVFPPGTYRMEREFSYQNGRDVALVGKRGSAQTTLLVRPSFQDSNLFDFGASAGFAVDGLRIQGFSIDMTARGAGACFLWAYAHGGVLVEDIVVDGVLQGELPPGKGEILLRLDVIDERGTALLKDISAPDGGEYFGSGEPSTGIYIGGLHAGSVTIENCEMSGFQDNGVYTSAASEAGGSVVIRGGRYANNDISNVRVGGGETLVEGVSIVQDSVAGMIYNNPRGLFARDGNATVRDTTIEYHEGDSMAIQVGPAMGAVELENVRVHQTTDNITLLCQSNSSSVEATGLVVVVEGSGRQVLYAEGGRIRITNSCIQAPDGTRDGLLFNSVDARVSNSIVNVSGTPIRGAETSNISYGGDCTL
jgi:hypothetical protein